MTPDVGLSGKLALRNYDPSKYDSETLQWTDSQKRPKQRYKNVMLFVDIDWKIEII